MDSCSEIYGHSMCLVRVSTVITLEILYSILNEAKRCVKFDQLPPPNSCNEASSGIKQTIDLG